MNLNYEVETRFFFDDKEKIFEVFHQLKDITFTKLNWNTFILNKDLFLSDRQLRISEVFIKDKIFKYLGFKDREIGSFCNIRKEIDEQIIELNSFFKSSKIINKILKIRLSNFINNHNFSGKINIKKMIKDEQIQSLEQFLSIYNLEKFLYFEGESEICSLQLYKIFDKEKLPEIEKKLNLDKFSLSKLMMNLKIMKSSYIKYPLLFEIEMIAKNNRQAFLFEKIIERIVYLYDIGQIMVKKEPPVILYEEKYF